MRLFYISATEKQKSRTCRRLSIDWTVEDTLEMGDRRWNERQEKEER